jgi:membrane protein DedA with SNARE-associated domain
MLDNRYFQIAVLVGATITIGSTSAMIYYLNRIKNSQSLSTSDLESGIVFNAIVLAIALVLLVWAAWQMARRTNVYHAAVQSVGEKIASSGIRNKVK